MLDSEWIEQVKKISNPVEMLQCIVDNEEYFGYDPYYKDLREAMLTRAWEIVSQLGDL